MPAVLLSDRMEAQYPGLYHPSFEDPEYHASFEDPEFRVGFD
jgi:hypothetical protein